MSPLLIATLAGDTEEYTPELLGKSLFRRIGHAVASTARSAAAVAAPVTRPTARIAGRGMRTVGHAAAVTGRTVGHGVATVGRAVGGLAMDAKRKIAKAVLEVVRPIVRQFAGDDIALLGGAEEIKKSLRSQKNAITAAAGVGAAAAGAAIAGPPGAAIAGAAVPLAIDIAIEEFAQAAKKAILGTQAAAAAAPAAKSDGKLFGLPASVVVGGAAVGAYLILKKKG